MWRFGIIIFVILKIAENRSLSVPSYIKPCSRSKDFVPCFIKEGNAALPTILKGDPALKIPNLLPLKLPKVDVESGPNLKIGLTDIEVYGLDTVTLVDANVDFGSQTVFLDLDAKRVELLGTYDVKGQIMVLPIEGNGPINITADNSNFKYTFTYKLEKRDGIEYGIIQDNDKLDFTVQKAYIQLDNLFNGDKALGDNVNKVLNENDQQVIKELGGFISEAIRAVARRVGGGIVQTVPFEQIFLP